MCWHSFGCRPRPRGTSLPPPGFPQPGRGHLEDQRRGRSSGDELILSWAQDHKPETLSNGPRCVLSQFRWDNSWEQQEADLVSMVRPLVG